MTQEQAQRRLEQLNRDASEGKPLPPLRERLDLYYKATGTTAEDYEYEDEEDEDE